VCVFHTTVGQPDGSQITASRTEPISLGVAGTQEEVSAIVVESVAFDCILRLPWLQDVNPVVGWEKKTLILPTDQGPVEVDVSSDPCRPGVPTPTLLTVSQLQEVAKEGDLVFLVTLKEVAGPQAPDAQPRDEDLGPEWSQLVGAFSESSRKNSQGCPQTEPSSWRST
jgi:hypothetical protein